MSINTISYNSNNNFINILDPRVKLVLLVAMVIIPMLFIDIVFELILVVGLLLIAISSGIKPKTIFTFIKPVLPLFFFLIIFDTLFESWGNTVFYQIGNLKLYKEGALFGLTMILRMLTMIIATVIVIVSTDPASFIIALRSLGVPHTIAFMLSTALRFVPTLMGKTKMIQDAQKSRGLKSGDEATNLVNRVSTMIPILIPLFVTSLELAQKLSLAMDARGFGASKTITYSRDLNFSRQDYMFLVLILAVTTIFITLRILGHGTTMLGTFESLFS